MARALAISAPSAHRVIKAMISVPHQLDRVSVTSTAMTKKMESMTVLPMARLRSPLGESDTRKAYREKHSAEDAEWTDQHGRNLSMKILSH